MERSKQSQDATTSAEKSFPLLQDSAITNGKVNGHLEPGSKIDKGPPKWRSQRYILGYFLFAGMANLFFQRINFSVAIVCMVNHTAVSRLQHHAALTNSNGTQLDSHWSIAYSNMSHRDQSERASSPDLSTTYRAPNGSSHALSSDPSTETESQEVDTCTAGGLHKKRKEDGPFTWTKQEQGLLLGAIYWTYAVAVVPANHLLRNVCCKRIIVVSMGCLTASTMLLHVAALWSLWAVFVLKLVQGACTAVAIIAMYGLWTVWGPPKERGKLLGFGLSGQMFSSVAAFPVSALLCKYGPLGGWPMVFYVFGIISGVWLILFCVFVDESPARSRFITEGERNYIMSSIADSAVTRQVKTPWKSILTSRVLWAVVFSQVSFAWNYFMFLSTLPQYMYEVLKLDIQANGLYSMLPYLLLLLTTYMAGPTSDLVIKRGWLRIVWTRRISVLISNLVPAVCLVLMSYMDCTQTGTAIALLAVGVGVTGFALISFQLVPYDVAPRFAPAIMTFTTSVATVCGILTPYLVSAIAKDQTREQWQKVFFLTAAILVVGAVGFCLLTSGELQAWAAISSHNTDIISNVELDMESVPEVVWPGENDKLNGNGHTTEGEDGDVSALKQTLIVDTENQDRSLKSV